MEKIKFEDPGALIDNRSPEEKEKDFTFEELVANAAPVVWREKSQEEWRSFPIYSQNGSGSCVAQTMAKLLGVYTYLKTGFFVKLSATDIYQRRANRPNGGMSGVDSFNIAQDGTTLEGFAPSQDMNDREMDAIEVTSFMKGVGEGFAIGNYMTATPGDIDTVASIIQETGKAVMVWFYFSNGKRPVEWTNVPEVHHKLPLVGGSTVRHSVAAVDFCLYKGQKALIIEDSWGLDRAIQGRRIITEDFFKARNFFIGHFMNFEFETNQEDATKPRFNFLFDLEFSPTFTTSPAVVALQNCLKFEGVFPKNVDSSGYYGSVTRTAVEQFQIRYGIAGPGEAGFGRVGPRTRGELNRIFN